MVYSKNGCKKGKNIFSLFFVKKHIDSAKNIALDNRYKDIPISIRKSYSFDKSLYPFDTCRNLPLLTLYW
jgi:hypothetical protein